jgi:hypothetical protein
MGCRCLASLCAVALDFAEIGNVAFDLVFPFPAPEGTAGALRFHGLETFVAIAPDAERNSGFKRGHGALEPGGAIDLNEQTMRYFDPDMQRGLIPIAITPLRGADWLPGACRGTTAHERYRNAVRSHEACRSRQSSGHL